MVTARRREEILIDGPIAITAISGQQLADKGAMDITAGSASKTRSRASNRVSGYSSMAVNSTTGVLNAPLTQALGKEGVFSAVYGKPRQVFVTGTLSF